MGSLIERTSTLQDFTTREQAVSGFPVVTTIIHDKFQELVTRLTGSSILGDTTAAEIRNKILQIEASMERSVEDGIIINEMDTYPLHHYFTEGAYARELSIPAGNLVVGKIHKNEHFNFISKGKVSVLTEANGYEVLTAPCMLISPAGVKRLLFTHEDTVWTVMHVTEERDVDKIEEQVIAKSYAELEAPIVVAKLTVSKEN